MDLVVKKFEELTVDELYEILKIRSMVFVVEQNCAYQDMDEKDRHSYHVFLKDDTSIKAYLRVLERGVAFDDVAIGRVLTTERGKGFGHRILEEGIKVAQKVLHADRIMIGAQTYIRSLYEKHGFVQASDEFLEDGIPHIKMMLTL